MIKFESVTKSYRQGVNAVENLDLELRVGEVRGFLGPNGAGKSTTIKMLVGILSPTSGTITCGSVPISRDPVAFKRKLAYVPDEPYFPGNTTGRQWLDFVADVFRVGKNDRDAKIKLYSEMFDIAGDLSEKVRGYSHGMAQKLALTAALLHDPEILVLDEPMVGLDPRASRDVKDIMRAKAAEGAVVFFSTHVLEVAQGICDSVAIIDRGKLVREGRVDELLTPGSSLEDFFLSVTED